MRLQLGMLLCVLALLVELGPLARAGQPPAKESAGEFDSGNYDDVLRTLVVQLLEKDKTLAQDAAVKLSLLGKHALPVLTELLNDNFGKEKGNAQAAYYIILALSKIKSADAVQPLLPILSSEKAGAELKKMVLDARGMECSEEGLRLLQKTAAENSDPQLRKEAYKQLSLIPEAWAKAEKLFVDALASPDDELRTLAAKQCYFCRIYLSAAGKLAELAEKDACEQVRVNAMLALAKMHVSQAVPALVRVSKDEQSSPALRQQAVRTINGITGIQFKDAAAVQKWWQNKGEAEYAKQEAPAQGAGTLGPAAPQPEKQAQAVLPKDDQPKP